jgi:hypothetical protein
MDAVCPESSCRSQNDKAPPCAEAAPSLATLLSLICLTRKQPPIPAGAYGAGSVRTDFRIFGDLASSKVAKDYPIVRESWAAWAVPSRRGRKARKSCPVYLAQSNQQGEGKTRGRLWHGARLVCLASECASTGDEHGHPTTPSSPLIFRVFLPRKNAILANSHKEPCRQQC